MSSALQGLKVLDVSRFIAGPFCAMQLGDHGADVVKVERIDTGEDTRANEPKLGGESVYFMTYNRNKRSFALDFRNPEAQAVLRELAGKADVLIENFRPGTMEQMGCGWETLSVLNPRLIMVRISGFGQTGPLAQRPCFDVIAQAMSGMMDITGDPDGPPTMAGTFVVDYVTALYGTIGVLTALAAREQTGRGQLVEATLLESAASLLMTAIPEQVVLGKTMRRQGNRDRYTAPVNTFQGADGAWVHIASGTDPLFRRLANAMGREDLLQDPRFATAKTRVENADAIEAEVQAWVARHTADAVVEAMDRAGIPCAKVATMVDVVENPQLKARGQILSMEHPRAGIYPTHGVTVILGDTPGAVRRAAPLVGEHTREVAAEWLGWSNERCDDLMARRVLG
ncbi:CaiB/BaiF CoA transferase family protein [Rhodoligotrophos defluvii]|uniref:CaiB/BaiF CoA transferase family protein n=1 Tax=Rhodoligotrophos defluvii TaxID=2561934 RepID=UPI0010C9D113|nr:CoA transferase [Rhodoligotrophos defluvii]